MRLLDRYLLRELLVPLGFCLAALYTLWVAFDAAMRIDMFNENHLQARDVVQYYLVQSPQYLSFLMPVVMLLASLYALTSLARNHELVAMRASGVGLWRVAAPFLVVGFVSGSAMFLLNDVIAPGGADRAWEIKHRYSADPGRSTERHLTRNLSFQNSRDHRTWRIGVFNQRTFEMTQPQVIWMQPDGSRLWILADRAIHTNDGWFFLGNVRQFREAVAANTAPVPVLQTNQFFDPRINEDPEAIISEIKMSARLDDPSAREADIPLFEILDYLHLHPVLPKRVSALLHTKLHSRLAAPFTCVVVVLIALPFGAASGRRSVFVGVAGSVFIFFAYYVLLQVGLAVGARGWLPGWLGGWLPNLIFAVTGIWLTMRVR